MKQTSRKTRGRTARGIDWSKAARNPHAAWLAKRPWHVRLDPELVDLLSGAGDPAAHLLELARQRGRKRERLVVVIPMTEQEFKTLRPLIDRIGAAVEYQPPHPHASLADRQGASPSRKAG